MIKNKKRMIFILLSIVCIAAVFFFMKTKNKPSGEVLREIKPTIGHIHTTITSTAIVQPQNRLEIKPPINGRIDKILVKEGDTVTSGQTLVMMSSTERAALLDAARGRGPEELKYWEDVYKPTPLISPINGEVIVSTDDPGQTITSSDVVMVLSDHLIVQAQVDETDIGGIRVGQEAVVSLDAYPAIKIKGKVDHIYYESTTVSNVTIYEVDILLETVPEVFRSGMSATVEIVEKTKDNALLLPLEAVKKNKEGMSYVLLAQGSGKTPVERKVEMGISDEKNVEIISGLYENDRVLVSSRKYELPSAPKEGGNPFMPQRPKKNDKK